MDRPILFSAPMVRALLAGTKSQTRRVVKPQPDLRADGTWHAETRPASGYNSEDTMRQMLPIYCPYGRPGDRLYVRETWAAPHDCDPLKPSEIARDRSIHYAATEERGGLLWRPSIHMPRWASRITLGVTDVRVERLRDISESDAQAEGIAYSERFLGYCIGEAEHFNSHDPRLSYFSLLEAINGPGSVEANPWVWCVSFKRAA